MEKGILGIFRDFHGLCWQRLLTVGIVECVNHLYDFAQLWF